MRTIGLRPLVLSSNLSPEFGGGKVHQLILLFGVTFIVSSKINEWHFHVRSPFLLRLRDHKVKRDPYRGPFPVYLRHVYSHQEGRFVWLPRKDKYLDTRPLFLSPFPILTFPWVSFVSFHKVGSGDYSSGSVSTDIHGVNFGGYSSRGLSLRNRPVRLYTLVPSELPQSDSELTMRGVF